MDLAFCFNVQMCIIIIKKIIIIMVSDCHKNCGTLLYVAHYYSYYCIGVEKVFFSLLFNLLDVVVFY